MGGAVLFGKVDAKVSDQRGQAVARHLRQQNAGKLKGVELGIVEDDALTPQAVDVEANRVRDQR